MIDINQLSNCLKEMGNVLEQNLIDAQSKAADIMWEDIYMHANRDTGAYALSIYKTPTEIVGNDIQTTITSDMEVKSSTGKVYNLGFLLEHGTDPHLIEPVYKDYLQFKIDGKWVRKKWVNHPGTKAYKTFYNAKINNRLEYQELILEAIRKSIKEGFK